MIFMIIFTFRIRHKIKRMTIILNINLDFLIEIWYLKFYFKLYVLTVQFNATSRENILTYKFVLIMFSGYSFMLTWSLGMTSFVLYWFLDEIVGGGVSHLLKFTVFNSFQQHKRSITLPIYRQILVMSIYDISWNVQ